RVRARNGDGDSNWSSVWSFTTSPAAPDSPLVGHWKMDEGGGSLLIDASQYGNNAPLTGGASWVSGVLGQAARFNGVSQYASVADNASLDITGAITVAGWIKPEAVGTQYLVKKAQQHETNGYELSLAGSGYVFFRFNQFSSGDAYRVNSTTPYPTNGNTWMHVAATYDGQSLRMYINGTLNGSLSLPSSPAIAVNGLPLTIGAEAGGYRGLQGAMDDVRIYNTALSLEEIQNIMSPQARLRMQLSMDNSSSEVEDVTMASDPFLFKKEIPEIIHAYPNPFATVTTVKFSFARDTDYTSVMYDINGREVLNRGNGTT